MKESIELNKQEGKTQVFHDLEMKENEKGIGPPGFESDHNATKVHRAHTQDKETDEWFDILGEPGEVANICCQVDLNDDKKIRAETVSIPRNTDEAANCKYKHYWKKAMEMELKNFHDKEVIKQEMTYDDMKDKKCMSTKWVFTVKDKGGWVYGFKARLVARGFSQRKGIDYEKVFAPVTRQSTTRMLTA